ncbi:CPBP family intramembrane glutamic endopeptidase [Curtobacterium oceanosedimentum]|uniref:CPBP family intramembrane glutamic endopeptidase n=1 Tax=Curtobacterium oceanosedimentum TaxID=465820 RepID=UPI003396FD8F
MRQWYGRQATTTAPVRRRRWPVPPSILLGLLPLVAFAAVSAWRSRPSDDYGTLGQTVESVVGALVLPEGIAVLVLCAYVTALGWWPIATVDRRRATLRWTLIAPALIAAVCLARLPLVEWDAQPVRYFVLLGVGVLFVGVFEELLTRGVLLVGLRRRLPEFGVWIVSCALFGLLHFLNVLAGAGVGVTVVQVVFAASFGSTLYLARRLTGNLLAPVLLHAAWDFGSIAVSATVPTEDLARMAPAGFIGLFAFAVLALGLAAGGVVAWRDDRARRLGRRWRTVPRMGALAVQVDEPRLPSAV